jgi:hypothetical protein
MAKQTTVQTKTYVVIDPHETIITMGTLEEIHITLENEWIDKMDRDYDTDIWLNSLSVYELKSPSKLKYTRSKLEIKP